MSLQKPESIERYRVNRERKFLQKCEDKGILDKIEILSDYNNIETEITCRCKCHDVIFNIKPSRLLNPETKNYCLECKKEFGYPRRYDIVEEYDELLHERFSNIIRVGEYINKTTKIKFKCLDCNSEFLSSPTDMLKRKNCPICGGGISFPNRIVRNLLILKNNQSKFKEFDFEWSPKWAKPYRYDGYFKIKDKRYVIEADGEQHKTGWSGDLDSLKKNKEHDKIKNKLARKYNITMIRIDCSSSDDDKVLESFQNNKTIQKILKVTDDEWKEILSKSMKGMFREICDYYNEHPGIKQIDMAKYFKLHQDTIRNALRLGTKQGVCNFTDGRKNNKAHVQKEVRLFNLQGKYIDTFESIKFAIQYTIDNPINIYKEKKSRGNPSLKCLTGKQQMWHDYVFRYKEDTRIVNGEIMAYTYEELYYKYDVQKYKDRRAELRNKTDKKFDKPKMKNPYFPYTEDYVYLIKDYNKYKKEVINEPENSNQTN